VHHAPRLPFALLVHVLGLAAAAAACGGSPARPGAAGDGANTGSAGEAAREDVFGPLEVGADYASYRRVTDEMFRSLDHGNRWVHVYVNELGAEPYLAGGDIPAGTIIVKTSVQSVDDRPSDIEGPIFVMEKRAKGYAPAQGDWWYAIHWANPPAAEAARFGGPFYWRGRSPRVAYCWKCHDDYVNSLGGLIPSSLLPR
jgi:hypothetical protein